MSFDWTSSGIGRALAVALGARGARVGLFARRGEILLEVAEEVESAGGKALALAGDVRSAADMEGAAARMRELWGGVDVLIANSGIAVVAPASSLKASEAADVITVNTIGVVNSVAAVLPDMLARRSGHLVVISSLASYRGMPKSAAYSASKAAVSTFFESLRVDLRGSGIDVTTIHPGFIRTPLTAGRKGRLLFLMELEDATRLIIRAIERRKRTYAFPWQLASIVRLIKWMPDALYDRLAANTSFRE